MHTLVLDDNHITSNGTARLARALASNTIVEQVSLQSNPIGKAGIKALAAMLKTNHRQHQASVPAKSPCSRHRLNPRIKLLNLAHTDISEADGELLAAAVEGHPGLHSLELTDTKVSEGAPCRCSPTRSRLSCEACRRSARLISQQSKRG